MRPGSRDAFGHANDELEEIIRSGSSGGSAPSGPTGSDAQSSAGGGTTTAGTTTAGSAPAGPAAVTGGTPGTGIPGTGSIGLPDVGAAGTAPGIAGQGAGSQAGQGAAGQAAGSQGSSAQSAGSQGSSGSGQGERLAQLGDELYAVANALSEHVDLRRHLVDPSVPGRARASVVESVLGPKVSEQTTSLVSTLASHRVSTAGDMVEAVEDLGRNALLAAAEADDKLSEVEDELFRFGRTLEREPRLRSLLADSRTTPDKRVELLDSVLQGRVEKVTHRLLEQLVRHPYTRSLDRGAEAMAEAAATRRDRSIARVTSPVALDDEQERRLADSLSSTYDRRISVHVDVDPDILGGLIIRVGGEVIDGSVSGRLRAAENALPG